MKRIFIVALAVAAGNLLCSCRRETPAGAGGTSSPGAFAIQAVVSEAKVQPVSESLSLVGTVVANEMVEIKAEIDGTVEEVRFEEGQEVNRGDLLLRLDEVKFAAILAEAEANFKLSRTTYERSKQLFHDKLISQQEHDQTAAVFQANEASLKLKERQLKDARILAPFSGVMSSRQVSPGQVISKNTTLTWLVDLDPVKVEFNVPERFVSQLRLGQAITIDVAAFPERPFHGEVFFIAPFIDPLLRSGLVKARLPNQGHELKPGMFANLDLTLRLKEKAIVIPETAVLSSGDRTLVYTVDRENLAQIRPVKLGVRRSGLVEIVSGLQPGERVIVEGVQKVRPGGKVKPVLMPDQELTPSASDGTHSGLGVTLQAARNAAGDSNAPVSHGPDGSAGK